MEERRRCAWLGGKLCDSTAVRKTLTGIYVRQRLTTTVQTPPRKGQRRHRTAARLHHKDRSVLVPVLGTLPQFSGPGPPVDPIQDPVCPKKRFAPNLTLGSLACHCATLAKPLPRRS